MYVAGPGRGGPILSLMETRQFFFSSYLCVGQLFYMCRRNVVWGSERVRQVGIQASAGRGSVPPKGEGFLKQVSREIPLSPPVHLHFFIFFF